MRRLLFFFPLLLSAQVQTIPNTSFPVVRTLLNNNFSWLNTNKAASDATLTINGVTITLGSANTLTTAQLTESGNLYFTNLRVLSAMAGLYESPLTFSAPMSRVGGAISLTECLDGELYKWRAGTGWTCEADQTGSPGSGITTLNGLTDAVQTFAKTDDANVTLTITSTGSTHTLALGWASTLAKARQHALTLYSDGSYSDPSAFTFSRTGGRLTGFGTAAGATLGTGAGQVPITGQYDVPLTFSAPLSRAGATISLAVCATAGQIYKSVGGAMICADDTGTATTGTTSATFQIASSSGGPKLKNNAGVMEIRNAADNDYADLTVKSISTPGGSTGEIILTEGTAPAAPAAGKQSFYIESTGHTPRLKNSAGTAVEVLTSASAALSFPTFNQNTTGTAGGLTGTPALPNGTTATTQSQADNSTKVASTAYVDTGLAGKQASDADLAAIAALACADGEIAKKAAGVWACAADDTALAGTGDFSSNTATSVDGEVVVFSGTAGKTGKRATATGIAKLTSGVLSAATAGTDYSAPGTAETTSGNRTLTGVVDASGATRTAPIKVGTSAPGTCTVGDIFYDSDATVGRNLYACTSTNTWTLQGDGNTGGGGGGTGLTLGGAGPIDLGSSAKHVGLYYSNTSGTGDFNFLDNATGSAYTVPAGKRTACFSMGSWHSTSSSTITYPTVNISGSHYGLLAAATSSVAGANHLIGYILAAGEGLGFHVNSAGVNASATCMEFDDTVPIFSAKVSSFSNGNNTVYTCASYTRCVLLSNGAFGGMPFLQWGASLSFTDTVGSVNFTSNFVRSGGSVASTNQLGGTTASVVNSRHNIPMVGVMQPGDFININVATSAATKFAWVNVLGIP
jgi:hypothetical protein